MRARPAFWGRRTTLLMASVTFTLVLTLTLLNGWNNAKSAGDPSVSVLGSGQQLSLLVRDGRARLLIAHGDDSSAFGNALSDARSWGANRIDIVLLAGSTADATFLSRARRTADGRRVELLGAVELTGLLNLPADAAAPTPRRYRLSDRTSVTIETASSVGESGSSIKWRAIIESGATRILLLSSADAAEEFSSIEGVSALIVGGDDPTQALAIQPATVLVTSSESGEGRSIRQSIAKESGDTPWSIRVFPGEVAELKFIDGGLALPSGTVQIEGSPEADA